MNPVDALFQSHRALARKAFMPFITAGDPDLAATRRVLPALAQAGASLIEIGFPFSDPIADGPIVQASYTRALSRGIKLDSLFEAMGHAAADPTMTKTPLVGMASYSLIFRREPATFLAHARQAGFSGMIVPDLPLEEAEGLAQLAAERDLKLILLVTPTTPQNRAARIARLSTGFLYVVSVAGITGERDRLPTELLEQLRWLRSETPLPLCVGFGVSKPEHVAMLRDSVDGVIVGSALVRLLAQSESKSLEIVIDEMAALSQALIAALNG